MKCYNCNVNNVVESPFVVAYRCQNCEMANCIACGTCHEMACGFFNKPGDADRRPEVSKRRVSFAGAAIDPTVALRRRQISTPNLNMRRPSIPEGAMVFVPDPSRRVCEACDTTLASSYFKMHLKTKKHAEAVRRKTKIEPEA